MKVIHFFFVVAKTQNISLHDCSFEELTTPSLGDFVNGNRDELLLCPGKSFQEVRVANRTVLPSGFSLFHLNN